jgi:hypothetical protein
MTLKSKMRVEELKNNRKEKSTPDNIFSESNAYRITERLAFPRLIGSEGEKRAIEIVLNEFKEAGYNSVSRDSFKTSFYNWIVLRYAFIPIGIFLTLLAVSFMFNHWLALGLIVLNVYIALKILGLATTDKVHLLKDANKNYDTENIYAKLKTNNSKVTIVFMAHWDSKSQTFSSLIRIIIFMTSALGFFILLLIYLILTIIQLIVPFNNFILDITLFITSFVLALIANLSYFNKTGNDSPGAYDNAAGVGVVIELARYYKNNPMDHTNFTFLCTSSEELNLAGAKQFIQKHKNKLDKNSTYFINFDLIGGHELIRLITSYGIPRKNSSKKLKTLFLESGNKINIRLKDIYLPTGAWSDYMPIVHEGFEACWLGSQPGLKFVHTKKDNMDLVSEEGIKNLLLLCVDVVKKLVSEYK